LIDESKYEGHTEGKWEYDGATIHATAKGGNEIIAEYPCWNYNKDQLITKEEEANLRLMADAPLLLAEVERLQALIRSKGLCTNCGQSHEGIEVVMDYSEDEVGHRISKECVGTCHPNLSIHCCDLCLCLNGFTIEHDYWEAKKND